MASDYVQQSGVDNAIEELAAPLSDNLMQHIRDEIGQSTDPETGKATTRLSRPGLSGNFHPVSMKYTSNYRKFNDVSLIRHRHVKFDQRTRKQLELLCEDRVSRYKFEEVHCSVPSSVKSTFLMTFSPDGRRVASTHNDHLIYICDLNTGKLLDTLEGHPKTPWCLAWHPSNREILASGCLAGEVRVWDLRSKACETWTSENHTIIASLDFHPKERVLVIATANEIHFWDWSQSEPFAKSTTVHEREKVKFVVFDSSGTKLITGINNLPKYAGYCSDSLQNRILDGYLSQGTIEPLPTDNMTQNSEITTSPTRGATNTNENILNERRLASSSSSVGINNNNGTARIIGVVNANLYDVSYRNTILLSRVAHLYRQLESLEDSMRHTSFVPFLNLESTSTVTNRVAEMSSSAQIMRNCQSGSEAQEKPSGDATAAPKTQANNGGNVSSSSQGAIGTPRDESIESLRSSAPTSNTFEPHLVTFDEYLEQLQLPSLIIDNQEINLATVIDQFPVDLSRQVHHAMQLDSINQVSQNFIRISKLMSSARLYRQVVQQIVSSNSGRGPYQPNQILTAQSVTARSPRGPPNLPIVLRNYPLGENPLEVNGLLRSNRQDPILAIEFRNAARNVPLSSICKIELIAARAICILRAQLLVEQALASISPETSDSHSQIPSEDPVRSDQTSSASNRVPSSTRSTSLQSIIGQLHATLMMINHTPLTTSNAYTHITTLRMQTEQLHTAISSLLNTESDGRRLSDLIHKIAFSLTGRSWNIPLGATLDEICLDVIHTLCIVDLTLHMTRQVQLLQMQRLSLIARVEDSRRPAATVTEQSSAQPTVHPSTNASQSTSIDQTSATDRPGTSSEKSNNDKRKCAELDANDNKRQKLSDRARVADRPMDTDEMRVRSELSRVDSAAQTGSLQVADNQLPVDHQNGSPERMVLWNAPHNQIDQSLQRLVVATSSGVNSHILVRVFNRMPTGLQPSLTYGHPGGLLESQLESQRVGPQMETRRRALSQDHPLSGQESIGASGRAEAAPPRVRLGIRAPPAIQILPPGANYQSPLNGGAPFDAWQRHPHLHVYQTRGSGPHLWFNQWTIPLPMSTSNYRLQCWNFARETIPNIKDSQLNVVTHKCRIHNESSVDISSNGNILACLVPRDEACFPNFDLKIFSLRSCDFGTCYYKLAQGPNAMSVSLSPSGSYAVVGLASHKVMSYDQNEDSLTIGKVYKIAQEIEHVRDIKIKRDDTSLCLNAIKWLARGIVYNIGPQHHQRYPTARVRNVVAS